MDAAAAAAAAHVAGGLGHVARERGQSSAEERVEVHPPGSFTGVQQAKEGGGLSTANFKERWESSDKNLEGWDKGG